MNDVLPIVSSATLLTDVDRDELPGAGLINSLGLVSALLLVQEQSAQGLPTLSPVQLALDALNMNLLNLEPGLVSLSSAVPPELLASLQSQAEAMPWSDLLGQAQSQASELVAGAVSQDDGSLSALGLESLTALVDNLQVLDQQLPDAMDLASLQGLAGVVPDAAGGDTPLEGLDGLDGLDVFDGLAGAGDLGEVVSPFVDDLVGGVEPGAGVPTSPVIDAPETLAPVTSPVQDVVTEVVAPVESLVALVPDVVEPVVDGVVGVLDQTTDVVEPIVTAIDTTTDLVADVAGDLLTSPEDLPATLVDGVDQVVDSVDAVVDETTDLLEPVTDLVTEGGTNLVDAVVGVVEEPVPLLEEIVEPVTEVVTGLGEELPLVEEVVAEVPLVSDTTGGTLPLVQQPSGEESGGTLGGLLG